MSAEEIIIHGLITCGPDETDPIQCPACGATHAHTIRGSITDPTVHTTLTCVSGHDVPIPDRVDPRELLFVVAMRAE